jgi:hypothetical protein
MTVIRERIRPPPDEFTSYGHVLEEERSWIGDINQHAAMKTLNSSSQLVIPAQPSPKSKRRRRSVIVASFEKPVSLGRLKVARMQEYGADFQKMNVVHSSAVQLETVRALWSHITNLPYSIAPRLGR